MAKFRTHYDNLNVSRDAPASVIKAAYKALCQKYHPDKYIGGHDEALRIMKNINGAYAVLSDSAKRAGYDQWIDKQERELAAKQAIRITEILTKNSASVEANQQLLVDRFQAMLATLRKTAGVGGTQLGLISSQLLKKSNRMFGLVAVVCAILAVTVFYRHDLKTAAVTAQANQEIATLLKNANQLVKQGQIEKALLVYEQLAKQGNAEAQFQVGLAYAVGQGVGKNDKQAADWFAKAAGQGQRDAQTKLGFMYATGKGVAKNYSSAIYWWYQAAEQGDAQAQYNLGVMYAKGAGVAKDNKQAAALYDKAAKQGLAEAAEALKQLDQ